MESPTHLSESNLRRYKGIRASKKSLYSCTDFYQKGENEEDDSLGPRSVSLTALSADLKRPSSALETSRMSQKQHQRKQDSPFLESPFAPAQTRQPNTSALETLEAKMASIEVSLSKLGALPRRKRNGILPGVARSLHNSHFGSISMNGSISGASISREFHKEIDFLKQSVRDKENLILNLQAQLRKLSKRKLVNGSITSTDSGVVSLRILSENERKAAEERLAQLDKDMDIKRTEIKRLTSRLERLDPSADNIDVRIQQAELEYELEREELNLMNLQEERRNLHTILDDNDAFQKRTENSLFAALPLNTYVAIHSFEVVFDPQDPSFTVGKREDKTGTYITWTRDDMKTLKRGDRIVEINGTMVVSKGVNRVEEFWFDEDTSSDDSSQDYDIGSHPLRIVIVRTPPPPPPPRAPTRELNTLKEELSLVTAKLEQVSTEKRELQAHCQRLQKEHQTRDDETEKVRMDSEKVAKERDNLRTESVRLKHRISYLEEQVTELLQRKEAGGPHCVTVFQKGNHKAIVAEPQNSGNKSSKNSSSNRSGSPSRPPSVASSRNCDGRQALKTRLWETFRRATTSDSRSVCSIDSNKHSLESGYFKKKSSDKSKKSKPPPPSKPMRLSLQRATSTTNVYDSEIPELNPGLKRSNFSENTLLPDWMSDDMRSEPDGHQNQKKRSSKHHGIRWPSLRPASSMSYTMGNRSTTIAKF